MKRLLLSTLAFALAAFQASAACSVEPMFDYSTDSLTVYFDNMSNGQATSYTWLINGEQITEHSPSYTFPAGGSYNVQLVAVGLDGAAPCFPTFSKDVIVLGDSTSTCETAASFSYALDGLTISTENTSTDDILTSAWTFDSEQVLASAPSHTFTTYGEHLVCLGVQSASCFDSTCKAIFIEEPIICDVEASIEAAYDGAAYFHNNASGTIDSAYWYYDNGMTASAEESLVLQGEPGGVVSACLIVVGQADGCVKEACDEVEIPYPPCEVEAGFEHVLTDDSLVVEQSANVEVFSTITWINGKAYQAEDRVSVAIEPGANYTVCVEAYGNSGANCYDSTCTKIKAPAIACDVEAKIEAAIDGPAYFHNISTGSIDSSYWIVDNDIIREETLILQGEPGDVVSACLVVFGAGSDCVKEACKEIEFPVNCFYDMVLEAEQDGDSIYAMVTAFDDFIIDQQLEINGVTYDSEVKIAAEPNGTYEICGVTVKDGCDALVQCTTITVKPNCEVEALFEVYQDGNVTYLENLSSGALPNEYDWVVDNGEPVYGELSELGLEPGWHSVCLTAWGENGCKDSYCKQFEVDSIAPDTCDVYVDFEYEIDGTVGVFERVQAANTTNYFWKVNGEWVSEGVFLQKNLSPGTHEVCLKAYSTDNADCWDIVCETIIVEQPVDDTCNVYVDFEYEELSTGLYTFERIADDNVHEYMWTIDNGDPVFGNAVNQVTLEPGDHLVCLKAFDKSDDLCYDQTCKQITVPNEVDPSCTLEADFEYIVDGKTVYFTNQSYGDTDPILEYAWVIKDQELTSENPVYTFSKAGEYVVCLTAFDGPDCSDEVCKTIVIEDPVTTCELEAAFTMEENDTAFVFTSAGNGAIEHWYHTVDGSNDAETSQNQIYIISKAAAGQHSICLIAEDNECFDESCKSITITGEPECDLGAYFNTEKDGTMKYAFATKDDEATEIYWSFSAPYPTVDMLHPGDEFSFEMDEPGEYHLCMYAYNGQCEYAQCETFFVEEQQDPTCGLEADFTTNDNVAGELIFAATANQSDAQFKWYVNNTAGAAPNAPVQGADLVLDVTAGGVFEVCLLAYNDSCEVEVCENYVIEEPCFVEAQYEFDIKHALGHFEASSISNKDIFHAWSVDGEIFEGAVLNHTFPESGEYEVCLTSYTSNEECVDEICETITLDLTDPDSLHHITGTVTDVEQAGGSVTLVLFWMFDDQDLIPLDTFATDNGTYDFAVEEGVYVIKTVFDNHADLLGTVLPTYYGNQWSWNSATSILVTGDSHNNDIELINILQNVLDGLATISGYVFSDETFKTIGDPLPGELVILLDQNGNAVASTKTDEMGYYEFTAVPVGEYQVYVDKVGAVPAPHDVSITSEQQVAGELNFVEATPIEAAATSVEEMASQMLFELYPNPAADVVMITGENISKVLVSNALGQMVVEYNSAKSNAVQLDIKQLEPGPYLITVTDASGMRSAHRLMKE